MIHLNSISKNFHIDKKRRNSLNFFHYLFERNEDLYVALKDISLELKEGDILGVVGKNGSGKSTLLKIISGILAQTSGQLKICGSVVYLSGFYNGINKNLSMRDNIYIIGTLNGLSKKQISQKIETISEFSGLEDFIEVPLYKFSNGMISKAVFSITIFTLPKAPDILLLDEVLGAGTDESFKEKALNKIEEYIESAKVVVIVNHNSSYILKKCSKVMWLEKGETKMLGNTDEVVKNYLDFIK